MSVTVLLPRILAPATGGELRMEVEATTVAEALDGLRAAWPGLAVHLFDESGELRPHVLCFVDGEATRLGDRGAPVSPGGEIRFVQAVSGG